MGRVHELSNGYTPPQEEVGVGELRLSSLVNRDNKLYHIFNFIETNYGGDSRLLLKQLSTLTAAAGVFGFRGYLLPKKIRIFGPILRKSMLLLSAGLAGLEFQARVRKYLEIYGNTRKIEGTMDRYFKMAAEFIKSESLENYNYYKSNLLNFSECVDWILDKPETSRIELLGYYDEEGNKILDNREAMNNGAEIFVLFKYKSKNGFWSDKALWAIKGLSNGKKMMYQMGILRAQVTKGPTFDEDGDEHENVLLKEFLSSFDVKNNILLLEHKLNTRPRARVEEDINQLDIRSLASRIDKVLSNGRRWGITFIGDPGVGKSLAIARLEEMLPERLFIRIDPVYFDNISRIRHIAKALQPLILVVEDIDGQDIRDKNQKLSEFINAFDETSEDLNIVILTSVNDSSLVNRTFLGRPGRNDEVIEVKPPQSERELYQVLATRFRKLKKCYRFIEECNFPTMEEIGYETLRKILSYKFTQAELTCGILEKMILNADSSENVSDVCSFRTLLLDAVDQYSDQKSVISRYKYTYPDFQLTNETESRGDDLTEAEAVDVSA